MWEIIVFTLINYSEYKVLEVSLWELNAWYVRKVSKVLRRENKGEKWNVGLSIYSKYFYTSSVTIFLFWGASTFVSVVTFGADKSVNLFRGTSTSSFVMISYNFGLIKASCRKPFAHLRDRVLISFEHSMHQIKALSRIDTEGAICGAYYLKINGMSRIKKDIDKGFNIGNLQILESDLLEKENILPRVDICLPRPRPPPKPPPYRSNSTIIFTPFSYVNLEVKTFWRGKECNKWGIACRRRLVKLHFTY